jgi:hypothetical protein
VHDVILFLVGIVVGAMNAIAGGGMLIGFPVLLASGLSALNATATSALIVLPGQISSAVGYRDYLKKVPPNYLLLIVPCTIGGAIGATLLRHTPSEHFQKIVPGLILFAVVLFAFQPLLHAQLKRHLHGSKKLRRKLKPLFIIGLAALPLSIYGGFFGPGFGFIMLALLGFSNLHQVHQINAMKNVMAVCIAGASVLTLSGSGLINWRYGIVMGLGNTIGGYYGAVSAQKVSSHGMRVVVIAIGVVTAIYLAMRSY